MNPSLKHVNYYKRALTRCCLQGMEADSELLLHLSTPNKAGTLVTPMFDTMELDCTYNRLVLEGAFSGCKLEVIVAATNQPSLWLADEEVSLEELMASEEINPEDKAEALCTLPHVRTVGACDMLLHSLTGRYCWVMVRVLPLEDCVCRVKGLRLEFPKYSFTRYFPEIYQDSEFFDRYIGLFQSVYLDLEREVDALPRVLDYESTDSVTLAELAGWLGVDNADGVFTDEQLRTIISNIDLFQGGKGTRAALERVIELVCGIRPRIVEQFRWDSSSMPSYRRELNRTLYGASGNHFCVILDLSQRKTPLPVSPAQLEKLIRSYTMLGTGFQLVFLQKSSNTDTHCYLDINSILSIPESASVDTATLGGLITVG